jgi:meso-butanediol dehydrogenase / (S,S)-butanediol dehydrogenase / diacetyl reductase
MGIAMALPRVVRRDLMGRLDGKTALVTGGARGLGRGIVLELAKEGADIAIADVLVDVAEQTAAEVRGLGRPATVVRMDVTDTRSVQTGIQQVLTQRGGLDILVNNAGVAPVHIGMEADEEDWDRCYEVNLKGIWKVSRTYSGTPSPQNGRGHAVCSLSWGYDETRYSGNA